MRTFLALLASIAALAAATPASAEQKLTTKPAAGAAQGGPTQPSGQVIESVGTKYSRGAKGAKGGVTTDDDREAKTVKGGAKPGSK